jgi:hypothetical protein
MSGYSGRRGVLLATYRFKARRIASETVSPRSAAFALAASQSSSSTRTTRLGVCVSRFLLTMR